MNTTIQPGDIVRHLHWTNRDGEPCKGRVIMTIAGRHEELILVEFETLPPRVIMPRRMALPREVLRGAEVST